MTDWRVLATMAVISVGIFMGAVILLWALGVSSECRIEQQGFTSRGDVVLGCAPTPSAGR